MKNYKKQIDKVYFDDNYFNSSINSLFFENVQLTVHKNGPGTHGWLAFRENNAFCAHKIIEAGTVIGMGLPPCPG